MKAVPTIVFALDSGDIDYIQKWSKEGFLPSLSKIIDNGVLKTYGDGELLNEMGSWIALFGGVSRAEFNYFHIRTLTPFTYTLKSTNSTQVTGVQPLWCHLKDSGVKALVIDPPDLGVYPDVPGLQLSHWEPHESERMPKTLQAVPAQLLDELKREYKRYRLSAFVGGNSPQRDIVDLQNALDSTRAKGQICRELIARDRFDLTVIGFSLTHTMGHRLFGYVDDPSAQNELRTGLRDLYQAIDAEIGLILAQLPAETNVMVVSTYGIIPLYPTNELANEFLEKLGYHARKAPQDRPDAGSHGSAWQSNLRRKLSTGLPKWAQERLIARKHQQTTDWAKTRAYSIESLYTSLFRVNLKGREPAGIVARGAEYHQVLNELEADLLQLVDPVNGLPAVSKVYRTTEVFGCEPHAVLPDLFVEWQPASHFRKTVCHPAAQLHQHKPAYFRSTWHNSSGFLAASGPCVESRNQLSDFGTLDFAPTILELLNVPIPPKLKGKPIRGFRYASVVAGAALTAR